MWNIDKVIDSFVAGDYFIIFLILTLIILLVLVLALIKSRGEYNELLKLGLEKTNNKEEEEEKSSFIDDDDILSELEALQASTKDDVIDENKPLIKQIDITQLRTYDDIINDYDYSDNKDLYKKEYDKLYRKLSKKYEGKELEYKINERLYQKGLYYEK